MAELNLKQIIDRLKAEFKGDTRKLVFWYDDKAEFEEDIAGVELENAKVYILKPHNQFQTKRFWNGKIPPQTTWSMRRSRSRMSAKTTWKTPCCIPSGFLLTVPPSCRLIWALRRNISRSSKNTSSFLPVKSGHSASTTWKSKISMRKISSLAFSVLFARRAPVPLKRCCEL